MDATVPTELSDALAPVLTDLEVVNLRPRIDADDWGMPEQLSAMSWWPDGSGTGLYVLTDDGPAERVAMVADQVQDAAVETLPGLGRPAVWPECPDHRDSHPLQARCIGGRAVWLCPRSERQIAQIGALASAL